MNKFINIIDINDTSFNFNTCSSVHTKKVVLWSNHATFIPARIARHHMLVYCSIVWDQSLKARKQDKLSEAMLLSFFLQFYEYWSFI